MSFFSSAIAAQSTIKYGNINIVWDGNSLTRSHHENSIEQYMPIEVMDWLSPLCQSLTYSSLGVGGQTAQQMIDRYDATIDPLQDDTKLNIYIVGEDANGVGNSPGDSDTGAGNLAKINTLIGKAKASGFQIVIVWDAWYKRTPYSVLDDAAARTRRQDYFNLTPGGLVDHDYYYDMKTLPNVGGVSGQAQDAYFYDHIHLNVIGNDELANKFKEILTIALAQHRV